MSVNRIKQSTAGALSLVAIVTLLTACAPARNLSIAEIKATQLTPSLSIRKDIDMVRIEGGTKITRSGRPGVQAGRLHV